MCRGGKAGTVCKKRHRMALFFFFLKTTLLAQWRMLKDDKCAQRHPVQVFARRPFHCPLLVFPALFDHFALVSSFWYYFLVLWFLVLCVWMLAITTNISSCFVPWSVLPEFPRHVARHHLLGPGCAFFPHWVLPSRTWRAVRICMDF